MELLKTIDNKDSLLFMPKTDDYIDSRRVVVTLDSRKRRH